ncbi:MAG TPA: hypothetical protein DHU81_06600, partial [Hyphomonas sp.]|nr:hypothetical protein [Hyphomonas sp.]
MSISEEEIHSIISKEAWDAMMAAEFDDEKGFDASHQIIAYAVCAWTLGFDGEFFLNQEKALELIAPPLSDLEYRRKVKRL